MLPDNPSRPTELIALLLAICIHAAAIYYLKPAVAAEHATAPLPLLHITMQAERAAASMLPQTHPASRPPRHSLAVPHVSAPLAPEPGRKLMLQAANSKNALPILPQNSEHATAAKQPQPITTPTTDNAAKAQGAPVSATANMPIHLDGELSVLCSERPEPSYPAISRRLGEEGKVVLRVELDEQGQVGRVSVENTSGHPALDRAAEGTIHHWHCNAPKRNGQAVRAVTIQPFQFSLRD